MMTIMRLTHCLNKFHYLRTLRLYKLEQMDDKFLPIINASLSARTLTHIELHGVRIVKDGHTLNIPDARLSHVEVDGTLFCTYNVLKSFTLSRNLEVLKLSGCRALMDRDVGDIIQRQNQYRKLKELRLDNCSKLMAPNIKCPTIQTLSLGSCALLKDLSLIKCENLVDVDLSYCSCIEDDGIKDLLKNNKRIERLCLKSCRGYTSIDIQSNCLRHLDMSMSMGMKKANIVCSELTSLEIGMCAKLEELTLELDAIEALDLSMLTMEEFSIKALEVKSLNLSGCCKLVAMEQFCCPKLMEVDICGTNLSPERFHLFTKTKVKWGGSTHDWSNPFRA